MLKYIFFITNTSYKKHLSLLLTIFTISLTSNLFLFISNVHFLGTHVHTLQYCLDTEGTYKILCTFAFKAVIQNDVISYNVSYTFHIMEYFVQLLSVLKVLII